MIGGKLGANSSTNIDVIEVSGLRTQFGDTLIHDNLDLCVRRGEVIALVGGSGSGKTTLLRTIIMLQRPRAGSVKMFGDEVWRLAPTQALALRRRFGVMFQQGALFGALTVKQNVAVPLREHTALDENSLEAICALKISLAGLPIESADKYPAELSGGMLKRAALARALALDPELLFLDEPTAGLDPVSANALDELIVQLKQSLGLTVVMVTHDLDSLWRTTDRVAFLGERRVIGYDPMAELVRSDHALIRRYFDGPRGRAAREVRRVQESANGI